MRVVTTASATTAVIPAIAAASATATVIPAVATAPATATVIPAVATAPAVFARAVPAVDKPVAPCVTGSVTLALATATSVARIGEKVVERVCEFA